MSKRQGTDEATFRAIYELRRGNFTRTVEVAQEALQENPQDFWAAFCACVAFGYLDERLDVVHYLQRLENIEEHSPYLAYLQAYVALWLSDTEKALWYWTRLLEIPEGWLAKELISQSRDFEKLIKKAQSGDISDFIILPEFFSSLDFSYETTSGLQMNFTESNLDEENFSLEEFLSQMLTAYTSEILELTEQNEPKIEQQENFAEQLTKDIHDSVDSSFHLQKESSENLLAPSAKAQEHLQKFREDKIKKEQKFLEKDRQALQSLQKEHQENNFEQTSQELAVNKNNLTQQEKAGQETIAMQQSIETKPLEKNQTQKSGDEEAKKTISSGNKEESTLVDATLQEKEPRTTSPADKEQEVQKEENKILTEKKTEEIVSPVDKKLDQEKTIIIATEDDYEIIDSSALELLPEQQEDDPQHSIWLSAKKDPKTKQFHKKEKKSWYEPPQTMRKKRSFNINKRFLYFFSLSFLFVFVIFFLFLFKESLQTQWNHFFAQKQNILEWQQLKINEWANVVSQNKDSQYIYQDRQQLIDDFELAKKIIGEGKINQARFLLQRIILSNADFKSKEKSKIFLDFIPSVSYQDFHDPITLKKMSTQPNFYFNSVVLVEGKILKEVDGNNGKILSALVSESEEKYLLDAFLPVVGKEKNRFAYKDFYKNKEENKEKMAILFGKFKGLIGQPPKIYLELEKIWY